MKTEVTVPSVGESITSGVIVSWLKHNGDEVQEGENLFELETDKAVLEIPSPAAGTLRILVEEGNEVSIGQTVASLESEQGVAEPSGEIKEDVPPSTATEKPAESTSPAPAEEEAEVVANTTKQEIKPESPATPLVEPEMARSEPSETTGQAAGADKIPAAEDRRSVRVPMTDIRQRTAERLVQAKSTAAYLTTFNEIDMQKVVEIRAHYKTDFQKEHGIRIGFMSFFVKACCQGLKEFPDLNAQVDGQEIIYNHFYDIGVAISIERGLLVPVIRNADKLHFAEIEAAIADLARRAQEKQLSPDELTGGTFTITNGGVFGSLLSTPIPAYPQSAILGMHTIKKRPVVIDDQIAIRPMMYVALTYDHRIIDGRQAVSFLIRIKEYIEDPDKLLLEL